MRVLSGDQSELCVTKTPKVYLNFLVGETRL